MRRRSAGAVAVLAAGAIALTGGGPVTGMSDELVLTGHGNDDTDVTTGDYLQVYTVNWENLPESDWKPERECAGDWRDLLFYMRYGPGPEHGGSFPRYTPDLLLVQQLDGRAELNFLVQTLSDKLDGKYAAVIANRSENGTITTCHTTNANGDQVQEKDEQTNAVIYRTGRFEKVGSWHWASNAWDGDRCTNNVQDRTKNVAVRLRDKIAGGSGRSYYVTAASIHWPTDNAGGKQCVEQNWREAVEEMDEPNDDELRIIGGDFNEHDRAGGEWLKWYQNANGEVPTEREHEANDYRDVIYQNCNEPGKNLMECLENKWTNPKRNRRIDFLFAQADGGKGSIAMPEVHAEHTVTYNEGDSADNHVGDGDNEALSYSQHRAIRARIHYPF